MGNVGIVEYVSGGEKESSGGGGSRDEYHAEVVRASPPVLAVTGELTITREKRKSGSQPLLWRKSARRRRLLNEGSWSRNRAGKNGTKISVGTHKRSGKSPLIRSSSFNRDPERGK